MKKFYITTPIYYVNDKPHLGHAYTTIAADILARWHRMKGEKVFFLTGTDEHGEKVAKSAVEQRVTPQEMCDRNSARFQKVFDVLDISYDRFIRTTEKGHEKLTTKVLEELNKKKLIYSGVYKGLYCVGCERYYTSKELVDNKCPIHQQEPVTLAENCYFFKLSAFQKPLLQLIKTKEWVIKPEQRRKEILGFLTSEKLEDLAISREKVEWGIPIPWNKTQSVYVWVEALLNYLSGINWKGPGQKRPEYWPPEAQLIGKDILRFHAILWPAMLLSLGVSLPKELYAHGYFTVNGQKMGKSLGNAIDPEELAMIFGVDALRWLVFSSFPFGSDGDISQSRFYDKYNNELCNGLGNLFRRVLALAVKSKGDKRGLNRFLPSKISDINFKNKTAEVWRNYEEALDNFKFEVALNNISGLIGFCDKYVDTKKPWKLFKQDAVQYQMVIYNLLESLRHLAWLINPFMSLKSDSIFECLGVLSSEKKKSLAKGKEWGKTKFINVKQGKILFPKL